jgi:hypothetical protein
MNTAGALNNTGRMLTHLNAEVAGTDHDASLQFRLE